MILIGCVRPVVLHYITDVLLIMYDGSCEVEARPHRVMMLDRKQMRLGEFKRKTYDYC